MMKARLSLPKPHLQVTSMLVQRRDPFRNLWALTGSAGLRLQGVDLPVHDLDVQTDAQTIYLLEQSLAEFMQQPVQVWESEHTLSYHGRAQVDGLQVELLGDVRHRGVDKAWEPPADVESIRMWVDVDGLSVPVLSLEHEALAYERMGRLQKAELIRATIQKETL